MIVNQPTVFDTSQPSPKHSLPWLSNVTKFSDASVNSLSAYESATKSKSSILVK